MVKDWSVYMQYIDSLYHKNQTSEGRIACIADYIYVLQKTAQQRVHLTAVAVGGLCFVAGVVIGKILEAG
jgi:hypothetical protein